MGGCNSRPAEDGPEVAPQPSSRLETHHQSSSTRAIAHSAAPPSTSNQGRSRTLHAQPSLTSNTSTPRGSTNLAEQPNAPLRQTGPWKSKKRTWTSAQLTRERYEFFETRVTGNAAIWGALKAATDLMREGDVATAQEILTAAGVTMPSGDLINGAWDGQGNLYRIPPEILRNPENIVKDLDDGDQCTFTTEGKDSSPSLEKDLGSSDFEKAVSREEKGKGPELSPSSELSQSSLKVRCRLSDRGGPDVVVSLAPTDTVSMLVKQLAAKGDVSSNQKIRIAYLGRMLKENNTLEAQGWKKGHVINALVAAG